ncbi:MAG: hypothetical protein RLZZ50_10 [Verrucomicrobiota bacterium]
MRLSFPLVAAVLLLAHAALLRAAPDAAPAVAPEAEGKIEGLALARPDGRFLGVEVEGVRLKVTFYDKEKKKQPADAVRITARWSDKKPRLAVLLPSSPETLASPPVLHRPFGYIVRLALVGANDQVMETYAFQPREAEPAGR